MDDFYAARSRTIPPLPWSNIAPPFSLYGARTGNSLRAAIALEEAGLAYVQQFIDLRAGAHRQPDFLALNSAGQVPILVDRRVSLMVLTQSNAIMMHIANAAPERLLPGKSAIRRARFHESFFYFITDVIAPNNAAFQMKLAGKEKEADYLVWRSVAKLEASERFLVDGPYMAGDRFTLADIAGYTIARASEASVAWDRLGRLKAWFDLVGSRDGVRRGLQAFDVRKPN
ncbi:glutathione S-transferase family protein [Sphingobium sp. RAC03]|uniref:glutathione S-transferase family protein n=1 Tax=Sphingobium sp. RAC03 TaxID=1843368 RepID=UPI000858A1DF|nr:glutathione S-transferase family protein [Sphingobium sp. RAC03]AOF95327.1 hypothetical protein BSY17_4172 [Sphingobium sp. RAC03]